MPRYFATDTTALDSTADSALEIASNASTAHRGFIYEVHVSFGTPADLISPVSVKRATTVGTGDTPTIEPYDPGDRASTSQIKGNLSAEPTTGDTVFELDIYHRLALVYKTPLDRPFVWPATANNGFIGTASHSSSTDAYRVTFVWEE